ncbi:MAG: hypothetical protein LKJ69_04790 [Lactobacillus sp.]|jgi:hypothetical protein|nr:hypothetical protein [Lactobacillus sp.]
MKLYCFKIVNLSGTYYAVRNTVFFDLYQYFFLMRLFGRPARAYQLTAHGVNDLIGSTFRHLDHFGTKKAQVLSVSAGGLSVSLGAALIHDDFGLRVTPFVGVQVFRILLLIYLGVLISTYWRARYELRQLKASRLIEGEAVTSKAVKAQIKQARVQEAIAIAEETGHRNAVQLILAYVAFDLLYYGLLALFWYVITAASPKLFGFLYCVVIMMGLLLFRWGVTALSRHPVHIARIR